MAETAVTSNLGWDNFFSTTTTGALTATTTTIPLATPPTPTEGFLILDPGVANEIIFYNSVSGNSVIVPTTDDRGRGDSTAQAHSSGITVKMNTVGMMFEALQSGLALTDSAIATAKLANNAVTSAKLKAAQSDSTPGSLADIGTGYSTGATLSVTAGTYLLIARATCTTSVAQPTAHVCEIYNSTDAAILDAVTIKSEYVSGTQSAYLAATNVVITTLAATKTIIARYKVDDSAGSSGVEDIKLMAIPVGV